jgi:hypothetical protein
MEEPEMSEREFVNGAFYWVRAKHWHAEEPEWVPARFYADRDFDGTNVWLLVGEDNARHRDQVAEIGPMIGKEPPASD